MVRTRSDASAMQKQDLDGTPEVERRQESGAAIPLAFGGPRNEYPSNMSQLQDEHSSYASVCQLCAQLTNYQPEILQTKTYNEQIGEIFQSLVECMQSHSDRRCRRIAAQTYAVVARTAYAHLKPSPLIYGQKDESGRLADEILTDVPAILCGVATDDADDGVSAGAIHSLGLLVMHHEDDDISREVRQLCGIDGSPYRPTLRSLVDEDPSIVSRELQYRVLDNAVAPRLVNLITRVLHYRNTSHVTTALPFLTDALTFHVKSTPLPNLVMDRNTFTKRWSEADAFGLINFFVEGVLQPLLGQTPQHDAQLMEAAAWSALRICAVAMQQPWVASLCRNSVIVLENAVEADSGQQSLEWRMASVAALMIANRRNPDIDVILRCIEWIFTFPATSVVPSKVLSAGVLVDGFRSPARLAFWVELAWNLLSDGETKDKDREQWLKQVLNIFQKKKILSFESVTSTANTLSLPAEIALAFCTAAVLWGRRNRTVLTPHVVRCQHLILFALSHHVVLGVPCSILEEDMSPWIAGQVAYTKLLQEYLHSLGLLRSPTSVALKLAANALPPHQVWDGMADSANFLHHRESPRHVEEIVSTSKIIMELIKIELKDGIQSHHMRMHVLTMAADHWVQCRTALVKKHIESSSVPSAISFDPMLATQIVGALNPKRMLAKILKDYVPPPAEDGKKRRDPMKKLGQETVRACTACIETIALVACDWRKRFGSGDETKKVVAIAVGALQGKVDDISYDEKMQSFMKPICDAAVARVQGFYEGDGSGPKEAHTPASELVTVPVKTKIKPLVSTSTNPFRSKDEFLRGYLTELCRQLVHARTEQALYANPPADGELTTARPKDWLRVKVPPIKTSRDGRSYGMRIDALQAWGRQVKNTTGPSDPVQVVLAYSHRRIPRYDAHDSFCVQVLFKVFNNTAIEFDRGLRLEIGVAQSLLDPLDESDPLSEDILTALGGHRDDIVRMAPLSSMNVNVTSVVKPGESITWESAIDTDAPAIGLSLVSSVIFRNVEKESPLATGDWLSTRNGKADASTTPGGSNRSGEDDFQVTKADESTIEKENVALTGEPLQVSPMIALQPCPLVFFDAYGDIDSFRFLWFRLPLQLPAISLRELQKGMQDLPLTDTLPQKLAVMSSLHWEGEAIPGGYATKAWAFMSLTGAFVCCLLTEMGSDHPKSASATSIFVRGDDKGVLFSLTGSRSARECLISALMPNMAPVA